MGVSVVAGVDASLVLEPAEHVLEFCFIDPKVCTRALRTSFERRRHLTNLMHGGGRKYDTDVGISFENVADATIDFGSMPGF